MSFYALSNNCHRKELAYVIGVMLGDGCLYKIRGVNKGKTPLPLGTYWSWRIELITVDRIFAEKFAACFSVCVKRPDARTSFKVLGPIDKGKGLKLTYRVTPASKVFGDWWFNVKSDVGYLRSVIGKHEIEFLRGLYDSEGSLVIQRGKSINPTPVVRIFSQNRGTLELAQQCAVDIGMRGAIATFRPAGRVVTLPGGKEHVTTSSLMMFSPLPAREFLRIVGSTIARKNYL